MLVVVTGFVLYLYVKLALFIVHSSSLNVIEQKAVPLLDDGALTDRIFQFKLHVHTLQYTDLTLIVHDQHRPSLAQKSSITFQTFCVSVEVIVVHKNPAILWCSNSIGALFQIYFTSIASVFSQKEFLR